ncbi:alpha/beta hydrolase family protein [Serinicoccus kebangsaanensis]|uniref:alpha/beta hydrolase family protein n=1 Tax=Serinicoccus kebangsaanensis TaxID=2602069 RepID=UPI00178C8191|nr:alpha/beta family hydrolase [Serinicoccus kebangsaanensis]
MNLVVPVLDLARQDVPTTRGPAQVRLVPPRGTPRGTLLLGHGAGGSRDAADVRALTTLSQEGWAVLLVDQPWRVAGRRVATPPPTLDDAWIQVVERLSTRDEAPDGSPLPRPWVYGGRSAGARVACRTSVGSDGVAVAGVAGVLCLAFPLHPPGRPERSRAAELARPPGAGLPTLVVNGARDPMGTPEEIAKAVDGMEMLQLRSVPGTHSPTRDLAAVIGYAGEFLDGLATGAAGDSVEADLSPEDRPTPRSTHR